MFFFYLIVDYDTSRYILFLLDRLFAFSFFVFFFLLLCIDFHLDMVSGHSGEEFYRNQ